MTVHAEIIIRRDQIATLGNELTSKDYLWAIKRKVKHEINVRNSRQARKEMNETFDGQISKRNALWCNI